MTPLIPFVISCLSAYYSIEVLNLTQLSLGADIQASIYKAESKNDKTYFVKFKEGYFQETTLDVLKLLESEKVSKVIFPIKNNESQIIQKLDHSSLVVYPFVEGLNGFTCPLTDEQWVLLGQTLKKIHSIDIKNPLKNKLRKEDFSSNWGNSVKALYSDIERVSNEDEIALKVKTLLKKKKSTIIKLIEQTEKLKEKIRNYDLTFVLCHSDLHAGNILIEKDKSFYIVDWDEALLAPKERDLMFIGGGVGNTWNTFKDEQLFYKGYGQVDINWDLITYYRCERILEDIAVYTNELFFDGVKNHPNKLKMYEEFNAIFKAEGVVDKAFKIDYKN